MLAFVTLVGGLLHLAVRLALYFYPGRGALGLPPADPVLFARLCGSVLLALGAAQLLAAGRPPASLVWGAALANGLAAATLVPYLLAGPAGVTAIGRALLWAGAAVLAGLALADAVLAPRLEPDPSGQGQR